MYLQPHGVFSNVYFPAGQHKDANIAGTILLLRFGHKLFQKGETCMISVYPNLIDRTKGSTIVCLSECSTIYYYILDFSCFTLFADYWWDWVIAVPNMAQCHRQSCRKSKWDRWQSYMYTPSTLNIVLIQWHTHLNVCAVK